MSVSRSFKVCDLSLSSVAEIKKNELYAVCKLFGDPFNKFLSSWDHGIIIFIFLI